MGDYTKAKFKKEFIKAIPNFKEHLCFFDFHKKNYEGGTIQLVWHNTVWRMHVYFSQYYIDLWKDQFIEFFETGEFDYNAYWKKYTTVKGDIYKQVFVDDIVYKIPLCKQYKNDFYEHSESMSKAHKRDDWKTVGNKHGLTRIPKSQIGNDKIIEIN